MTGGDVDVIVGVDVGGGGLAVRAETLAGDCVVDTMLAAHGWEPASAPAAAAWLRERLTACLPGDVRVRAAGVGAQGCDSPQVTVQLQQALGAVGLTATVVSDGALLIPAAGLEHGIALVADTGSVAIGTSADGEVLLAGGWGWVLGDEGGAAALVREATRAALSAHDAGQAGDGLLAALLAAFAVPTASLLARAVNDEPTVENWAPRAPAVFAAADAGSPLAAGVIVAAAGHLAALVGRLLDRGALGTTVVAAGSVIVGQPRLAEELRAWLSASRPDVELRILTAEPVTGAVTLARRLLAAEATRG